MHLVRGLPGRRCACASRSREACAHECSGATEARRPEYHAVRPHFKAQARSTRTRRAVSPDPERHCGTVARPGATAPFWLEYDASRLSREATSSVHLRVDNALRVPSILGWTTPSYFWFLRQPVTEARRPEYHAVRPRREAQDPDAASSVARPGATLRHRRPTRSDSALLDSTLQPSRRLPRIAGRARKCKIPFKRRPCLKPLLTHSRGHNQTLGAGRRWALVGCLAMREKTLQRRTMTNCAAHRRGHRVHTALRALNWRLTTGTE